MKIKQLLNAVFCCITQSEKTESNINTSNVDLSNSIDNNDVLNKSKTQLSKKNKKNTDKREGTIGFNDLGDYGIGNGNIPTVKQKNENNILTSSSSSEDSDKIGTYIPEDATRTEVAGANQYSDEDGWIV